MRGFKYPKPCPQCVDDKTQTPSLGFVLDKGRKGPEGPDFSYSILPAAFFRNDKIPIDLRIPLLHAQISCN